MVLLMVGFVIGLYEVGIIGVEHGLFRGLKGRIILYAFILFVTLPIAYFLYAKVCGYIVDTPPFVKKTTDNRT